MPRPLYMRVCQGIGSQLLSWKVAAGGWSQLLCGARTRPGSLPLPLPLPPTHPFRVSSHHFGPNHCWPNPERHRCLKPFGSSHRGHTLVLKMLRIAVAIQIIHMGFLN